MLNLLIVTNIGCYMVNKKLFFLYEWLEIIIYLPPQITAKPLNVNAAILYAVIALCGTAIFFAVIIFFIEMKFKVIEDPLIDEVQAMLPGANCGGCGFAGCRNFAEALVKAKNFEKLSCPVGGNESVTLISPLLGIEAVIKDPTVAVLRCNGSHAHAPQKAVYEGATTCYFAHSLFSGESGCPHGCLGLADCVVSCQFDAMYMDEETGLPVILEDKCVSCGKCVKACPRAIIELRKKGKKNRRIYVNCVNKEKGGPAKKNCSVACIGCGACLKACKFEAITLEHNLAYINAEKCTLCRKCYPVCPTKCIIEMNLPERKAETTEAGATVIES